MHGKLKDIFYAQQHSVFVNKLYTMVRECMIINHGTGSPSYNPHSPGASSRYAKKKPMLLQKPFFWKIIQTENHLRSNTNLTLNDNNNNTNKLSNRKTNDANW